LGDQTWMGNNTKIGLSEMRDDDVEWSGCNWVMTGGRFGSYSHDNKPPSITKCWKDLLAGRVLATEGKDCAI
jgi:hypothetical protein